MRKCGPFSMRSAWEGATVVAAVADERFAAAARFS
jgi:hypothetical protein